ncbi:MAG: DsrE family protein [Chromatiales bacterium]|nr:DsrE family protein [Chromatiales bacterium]
MRITALLLLLIISSSSTATSMASVESLLQANSPPSGVIFEIIEAEDGLRWAIPQIVRYSQQLRERFPDLPIAVVSHGREEFALQSSNRERYPEVHLAVASLSQRQEIPVHVCGTHAGWRNVSPEEFPDYVDVAPTGPAQIQAYQELGYQLIVVTRDQKIP